MDPFGNTCIITQCHITTWCNLVIEVESILPLLITPINFIVIENSSPGRNDLLKPLAINLLLEHLVLAKIPQKD